MNNCFWSFAVCAAFIMFYRYVTYHIGTFKGKPAQMAAFFGDKSTQQTVSLAPRVFTAHDGATLSSERGIQ
ncbi:MAG: hypothetical protein ACYC3X_09865 [Pirellulaceae bacterium]